MNATYKPRDPSRLGDYSNPLVVGGLVISVATREAWLFGRKLALTAREFDLLTHLAEHPGWVFSPEELLHQVWGYEFVGDPRVVSVHIGNVRRKLGKSGSQPRLIHTVRGLGYKLMSAEAFGATNVTGAEDHYTSAVARNPLVRRRAELMLLAKALDAACQGRGSVALLVGEAGMGKTRLAQELDSVATLAGALVLWGRCHAAGAISPYWPWIQIAEQLVAKLTEDRHRRDLPAPTRGLGDLLAEVTQSLPDPTSTDWAELADPRTTVLDALLHIHISAAAERTLVLILDDLDQSDAASLLVLQVLASHLEKARILVVATMSSSLLPRGHPLSDTLAVLANWSYQRIQLPGLTLPETAELISLSTGRHPSPAVVEAVHRQSEGNPLFVSELAHLLAAEGRLDQEVLPPDHGMPLPAGVHDVIGRRLARVSPECQRLLELGSIVGRSFSLEVLHLASGLEFDRILELITEALEAHLIQGEAERGHFRFTHSLVREVLVADLGDARRLGLYARLALALEQASDPEDVLDELAHYFCQAAPLGYGDKAIEYSRRAGVRAMERFAYEDAAQHFHTALTLMPASKAKVEERRQTAVSLQESHCQALALCSRPDEAVAAYHRGLSLVSPADWLGRARLHRMGALAWQSAQNADAALRCLDFADQALATAGNQKDDQYRREWIDLALARMKTYYYAGDVGRLRQVIESASEPIDSFGTEEQKSTLDIKRLACAFREERFQVSEKTVAQAREQWTRSQDNVDPYRRSQAEFLLGFALLWHGELDEAEVHLKACREIAERSRDKYRRAVASTYLAVLDRVRMQMETTQAIALRAAEEASDARLPGYVAAAKANLAWVALRQGDTAAAQEEARKALRLWKALSAYPFEWLARGPLLRILLQRGDLAGGDRASGSAAFYPAATTALRHSRKSRAGHRVLAAR